MTEAERRRELNRQAVQRYRDKNREKIRMQQREHKQATRAYDRGTRLKRVYKITLEDYDRMLDAQGGGCAICGRTPEENGARLHVDHDHNCCPNLSGNDKTCGECVRGLLCGSCNRAIGLMDDEPERLEQAAEYIRSYLDRG